MTIKDCESCKYWQECFGQHKDADDALKALDDMEVCDICLEDAMQE